MNKIQRFFLLSELPRGGTCVLVKVNDKKLSARLWLFSGARLSRVGVNTFYSQGKKFKLYQREQQNIVCAPEKYVQ